MRYARGMTALAGALSAVLLLSCGFSQAVKQAAEQQKRQNDLMQIGMAYQNHVDANNKAPTKADDLSPYLLGAAEPLAMLRDGSIVFLYGVTIKDMTAQDGTANTVLAYESKVPNEGGLVLMGDASVRTVTAAEFKGMPQARPAAKDEKNVEKPTKDTRVNKDTKKL